MSGELQSIPARHGTATFVPKGQTIKVINTYGKQVVDTWVFALPKPPDKEVVEQEEEDAKQGVEEAKSKEEETIANTAAEPSGAKKVGGDDEEVEEEKSGEEQKETEKVEKESEEVEKEKELTDVEKTEGEPDDAKAQQQKAGWSSYLPSIRSRGKQPKQADEKPEQQQQQKSDSASESRTWGSYFPSGKGFSNYLPSAKTTMSAFATTHKRDPTKSYAEQLYDFSKTPVGAATLSAATGSGVSSSIYAAYSAYTKIPRADDDLPPMEYYSAPHTRAESKRLIPKEGDTLISNLHTPLVTLIEDTTAGHHDTLTPACDALFYRSLKVAKWEEHGSCAENLVLALSELNEKAGLKGRRAVGADVSVNIAPTPLHLFMNSSIDTAAGQVKIEEPKGPKRSWVKFRAERDVVVVMSACPNEKGVMNGGKCMAANFIVEEEKESDGDAKKKDKQQAEAAAKANNVPFETIAKGMKSSSASSSTPAAASAKKPATALKKRDSTPAVPTTQSSNTTAAQTVKDTKDKASEAPAAPKPERKKPKKLERRNTPATAKA